MSGQQMGALLGGIQVHTTNNRGWSAEELADRCAAKIIHIGTESPPVIRAQAEAYKAHIHAVLVHFMEEAKHAERTSLYAQLQARGQSDLAEIIRSL